MKKKLTPIVIGLQLILCSAVSAQIGGGLVSKVKKAAVPDKHLEDQGITGATHQKYVEQVVWSNEKIQLDNPDESKFKSKFESGEHIYGRFYLSESLQNFYYTKNKENLSYLKMYFNVYIDGVLQDTKFEDESISGDIVKRTTQQMYLHIKKNKGQFGDSEKWVKMVNTKMTPGEHTVKFDLHLEDCEGVAATGSFTYVKGKEDAKLGWSFADYYEGMNDKVLQASVLKKIQDHATSKSWNENFTKVIITSDEWKPLRNELTGVISVSKKTLFFLILFEIISNRQVLDYYFDFIFREQKYLS